MKIHWLTQSAADIPASTDWLHPSEEAVFSKFRFAKKRNDWLLGRWTAKKAVQFFLKNSRPDLPFEKIAILAAADGAPEVFFEEKPAPVFLSLSHSHDTGFCVVGPPGHLLGCDLEKIEPRSAVFIREYFTEKEQTAIAGREEAAKWANLVWSAKESTLKALRSGLRTDPRKVEVDFSPAAENFLHHRLKVTALEQGSVFNGYWWFSPTFVFTIVGVLEEFELVEISGK